MASFTLKMLPCLLPKRSGGYVSVVVNGRQQSAPEAITTPAVRPARPPGGESAETWGDKQYGASVFSLMQMQYLP